MLDNTSQRIYAFALRKLSSNDIPEQKLRNTLLEKFITKNKKITQYSDADQISEITEKIEEIIILLKSQKYIDDERYCENFIRWRKEAMPRGKYMITQELILKKIDADFAQQMCEKHISYTDEKNMCEVLFVQKLEKLKQKFLYTADENINNNQNLSEIKNNIKQKLFSFLAGKQFSYSLMTEIWEKNSGF